MSEKNEEQQQQRNYIIYNYGELLAKIFKSKNKESRPKIRYCFSLILIRKKALFY